MTYKMDNVNQIMDALKELDGRSLGVFQRRYADFMQDLSKNRMNNGKLKKKPKIISEEEKEKRHQARLQRPPPPGWATLSSGRIINAKKGQDLPKNVPTSEEAKETLKYINRGRAIKAAIKEREEEEKLECMN
jgi:hypothetical protein